jgi:hypothetical protein
MAEPDPFPSIKTPWDSTRSPSGASPSNVPPILVADHTLIRRIGKGSYGEVWLARNVLGVYRAVKIIERRAFEDDRPFEREFAGMQRFEPVSRSHASQLNILHVGRGPDCFYYVMELADDMGHGTAIDEGSYTPRNLRSELLLRGRLAVDEQYPERSRLHVEIEAASLDTRTELRDTHLRSADFLHVDGADYREEKIDLPQSWLRGFMQTQAAMTRQALRHHFES